MSNKQKFKSYNKKNAPNVNGLNPIYIYIYIVTKVDKHISTFDCKD